MKPAIFYLVLALLVIPVYPHFPSPNEMSRWALAVAVVDDRSFEVTNVLERANLRRIEDIAVVEGRKYSNKAPGMTLLAAPAYLIVRPFTGRASAENIRPTLTAMRIVAATVPAILVAFWMAGVARRAKCDRPRIVMAVTALLFATPLFAYGLLFFSHALSAFALFGTWALLFASEPRPRSHFAAGTLIGFGVLCEYPNAVPALVIVLCALGRLRSAGLLRLAAGGVPFALFLALYNRAAFGSFFTLSSAHEADPGFRELASRGLFGIGVPSAGNVLALLADPSKGLLILSPVLAIAALGIPAARRAFPGGGFVALLAAPAALLVTIAGYPNWHGGWTVGARYLVAALPFLSMLIAFARPIVAEPLLLGASAVVISVLTLVFPFVPPEYAAPWITFAWPLLADGLVAPNLLHLIWRPLAIAVPFAIVVAAIIAATGRRVVLAAAGLALWFAAGAAVGRRTTEPPVTRAIVQEVYFERDGAIREALPPAPSTRAEAFARRLRQLPPSSWPF